MPFSDVIGQDRAITVLRRSISMDRVAHAYLFTGIEGCGKKKSALAFIQAVFCGKDEACGVCSACKKVANGQHPDLHILQPDGAYEANPPEDRALRAGENLITSGSTEALSALRARA